MLNELKRKIKSRYTGISWQNPLFQSILPFLDLADFSLRLTSGREYLPRYSERIRSNGIQNQLGGRSFVKSGAETALLVRSLGNANPQTEILDIGCGSGRVALALTSYLDYARYTGIDVDKVSIDACKRNPTLQRSGFRFLLADVASDLYNAEGQVEAREYTLPFPSEDFDVVFLHSVFTHMLPEDVSHYIEEISRVLRPGGRCIFTTFLIDFGLGMGNLSFPYDRGTYFLHQELMPLKAVSYQLNFFDAIFGGYNMRRQSRLLGTWRQDSSIEPDTELSQDILVYERD